MTRKLLVLAITAAIAGVAAPALAQDSTRLPAQASEIQALKEQLAVLSARLEQLEKSQATTKKTAEEAQVTADRAADNMAQEKSRLSFNGDIRYRNESFDVEYVERNRSRDRVRARLNANYRVNDTVTGVFGIATGGADPRSSNQTLTDQNSRKDFELDLAYVQWAPNAAWRVTAGKQRYSWQRSPSLFFDGDVNPEGISVNYTKGNLFAGVFHDWLAERALSFSNVTSGTNTDSMLYGAQLGYRIPISDSVRLTVAGTYFNFDGVQGYNPLFGGSAFGNTTVTGVACSRTLAANTPCLASDFDVIEGFADLTTTVAGRPLRVFLDYARNTAAEVNAVAGEKLDTALAIGFGYGAASATPRTWEIGALYQQIEKDSLFGQFLDSDFGDGNTDSDGLVLRGGYTLARNLTLNGTLFLNQLSNDVPQTVTVFDATTPAPLDTVAIPGIFDRDYKRLQLDLNFRF
jgi:type II secretory pathway component PulJ